MKLGADYNYWPSYEEDLPLVLREQIAANAGPHRRAYRAVDVTGETVYFVVYPSLGKAAVCEKRRQLVDWVEWDGRDVDALVSSLFENKAILSPWM